MKKTLACMLAGVMGASVAAPLLAQDNSQAGSGAAASGSKKPDMNKVSYTIGYEIGSGFKSQNIDVNTKTLTKGLKTGLSGDKPAYSEQEMERTMQAFQKEMMSKAVEAQEKKGEKNLKTAKAGMEAVAKKDGVKKLADGIYYQEIKQGDGKTAGKDDTVKVNYKGSILQADGEDGKEFDNSYKRNAPVTFMVNQVIPCWTKALEKMPQGATWKLYCAPGQAYGKFAPPAIGPNQALSFKVQLLKVNPKSARGATVPASS